MEDNKFEAPTTSQPSELELLKAKMEALNSGIVDGPVEEVKNIVGRAEELEAIQETKGSRIEQLQRDMHQLLTDAGGFGQIGMNSPYWNLRRELHELTSKK